jgi:hypothetical protein
MMIELLQLGRQCDYARLSVALEEAIRVGSSDAAVVRYLIATSPINCAPAPLEAQQHKLLSLALQRWARYDLIVLDEVGYAPFAQVGAELLFQVISERAEKATLIITTNLPFSEWTQDFPSARLCKALLDRITDRAHIIETGTESNRFKRTVAANKKARE